MVSEQLRQLLFMDTDSMCERHVAEHTLSKTLKRPGTCLSEPSWPRPHISCKTLSCTTFFFRQNASSNGLVTSTSSWEKHTLRAHLHLFWLQRTRGQQTSATMWTRVLGQFYSPSPCGWKLVSVDPGCDTEVAIDPPRWSQACSCFQPMCVWHPYPAELPGSMVCQQRLDDLSMDLQQPAARCSLLLPFLLRPPARRDLPGCALSPGWSGRKSPSCCLMHRQTVPTVAAPQPAAASDPWTERTAVLQMPWQQTTALLLLTYGLKELLSCRCHGSKQLLHLQLSQFENTDAHGNCDRCAGFGESVSQSVPQKTRNKQRCQKSCFLWVSLQFRHFRFRFCFPAGNRSGLPKRFRKGLPIIPAYLDHPKTLPKRPRSFFFIWIPKRPRSFFFIWIINLDHVYPMSILWIMSSFDLWVITRSFVFKFNFCT